jgi:hypothetical protein
MLAPVSEDAVSFLLQLATNMHRIGVRGSTIKDGIQVPATWLCYDESPESGTRDPRARLQFDGFSNCHCIRPSPSLFVVSTIQTFQRLPQPLDTASRQLRGLVGEQEL